MRSSYRTLALLPIFVLLAPYLLMSRLLIYLLTSDYERLQRGRTVLQNDLGGLEEKVRLAMLAGDRETAYRSLDEKPLLEQKLACLDEEGQRAQRRLGFLRVMDRLLHFQR